MPESDALVVSSDPATAGDLRRLLDAVGVSSQVAGTVGHAAELLQRGQAPRLLVVDSLMSDGNVLDFLARHEGVPPAPVLVVAAPDTMHLAQGALRLGAKSIVSSPFDAVALQTAITAAMMHSGHSHGRDERAEPGPSSPFVGPSGAIRALARDINRVAKTDVPVLIQGETGTGKGVLARWIHDESLRAGGPFIDVNCAALSKELFESEMCGFEKGAFTGATSVKVGLMEAAEGGTMFLDEIGDLDLEVQPRMLKLIEEKRFRRLGSVREQQSDVRFIAASNQDLNQLVRERRFRADLLFRINTMIVVCPPLRDRAEDVPALAARFLAPVARHLHRPFLRLSREALDVLSAQRWPGNIRELQHVVERAALMSDGDVIGVDDLRLHADYADPDSPVDAPESITLEALQLRHIQLVLDTEDWHVERAARRLGMPRSTLYQKIKQHGLGSRTRHTQR